MHQAQYLPTVKEATCVTHHATMSAGSGANALTAPQRERSSALQIACRCISQGQIALADPFLPTLNMPITGARLQDTLHAKSEVCELLDQAENVAAAAPLVLSSPPHNLSPTSPHRCCHRCPPHHPLGSSTLHQLQSVRLCKRRGDTRACSLALSMSQAGAL